MVQYSAEAIQEFRKKDLQTRKAGIIITFYTTHKKLPTSKEMDEWLDLVYKLTEKDKVIINPDYIPNTETGAPFKGDEFAKNKSVSTPLKDGKVDKKDLNDA